MRFIENGQVIEKEQPEGSKNCGHWKCVATVINETKYRHCEKCNMIAHEDGSFAYGCGFEWCRCMN
jgi:hypothetical protein